MRKNYFTKSLIAATMLLSVSSTMVSCSGLVDAVFGTEDNPTNKPEKPKTTAVVEITANQTTITISSLEDLAGAISAADNEKMVDAIKKSADAGEEYVIEVKSEKSLSTKDFEEFEIPRVEEADIKLVFDKPLTTSEDEPLVITADEKESITSTDAVNKLTIVLPDGSDDVYLSLDLPETTVILDGKVTYHYVEALTAKETLYVESDVTIEELLIKDGFVVVKDGGVIETYVYNGRPDWYNDNPTVWISYNPDEAPYAGVHPRWQMYDEEGGELRPEIMRNKISDDPYICKFLKIVDVKDVWVEYNMDEDCSIKDNELTNNLEKMTIGDGVTVHAEKLRAKTVIGEGTAKVTLHAHEIQTMDRDPENGYWDEEKGEQVLGKPTLELWVNTTAVENMSNIIFTAPVNADENNPEYQYSFLDDIPATAENCTFEGYDNVYVGEMGYTHIVSGSVMKGCKFNISGKDSGVILRIPGQAKGNFNMTFSSCDFSKETKVIPHIENRQFDYDTWGYTYTRWWPWEEGFVESKDDIPSDIMNDDSFSVGSWGASPKPLGELNDGDYDGFNVTINFKGCKLGGSKVTSETIFLPDNFWVPDGVKVGMTVQ